MKDTTEILIICVAQFQSPAFQQQLRLSKNLAILHHAKSIANAKSLVVWPYAPAYLDLLDLIVDQNVCQMLNAQLLNHVSIEDAEILVWVCVGTKRNATLLTTFPFAAALQDIEAILTVDAKSFPPSFCRLFRK